MSLTFRKPLENIDHPKMPADVVIVGGGPGRHGLRVTSVTANRRTQHNES